MIIKVNDKPILFRCDRKACGKECPSMQRGDQPDDCHHTTFIEHAIFDGEKELFDFYDLALFEREAAR